MTLKNKNAKQNHMNRLINILKIISCILYQHSWYYRYYVDMKADKMEFKKNYHREQATNKMERVVLQCLMEKLIYGNLTFTVD